MTFDLLLIIALALQVIIIFLTFLWFKKEKKPDALVALVAAFFGIVTIVIEEKKDEGQMEKLTGIYETQADKLRDTLSKQIISLKATRDSLIMLSQNNNRGKIINIIGNDNSTISIADTEKPFLDTTFKISDFTHTRIHVNRGDKVFIQAYGSINLGRNLGPSGPEGRDAGVPGFSLADYNIIRSFKHGALMYIFDGTDEWVECGSNYKFTSRVNGDLVFDVNDKYKNDNSGAFNVAVTVYR